LFTLTNPHDSDTSGEGKRARRSSDITKRLLDAAVVEFSERGFEAAKVADITRRSGLTTGSIYARWRGKRELFLAAVNHVMSQRLMADSANDTADPIAASLGAQRLRSGDDDASGLFLEAYVLARRDTSVRAGIAEAVGADADALSKLVNEGKAAGIFDQSLNTELVVLCCQALSIGTLLALSMSQDRITGENAEQWDELIRRMVSGWAPAETRRRLDG
jgi:AcrR family transcriptional regulator